jgi:hypothetical protein
MRFTVTSCGRSGVPQDDLAKRHCSLAPVILFAKRNGSLAPVILFAKRHTFELMRQHASRV